MLVLQILEKLGWDGLRDHASEIRGFYRQRRDEMLRLADKYLTGIHSWL
jgi:DNA-binding transcriptional MocR family regulator